MDGFEASIFKAKVTIILSSSCARGRGQWPRTHPVPANVVYMMQAVCELGRETINTPVYVQMDAGECHVMTDSLAAYTLTGEPRTASSRAVKILRLAAFAPQLPTSVDFNLRVYFVEDTQDALEVCAHRLSIQLLQGRQKGTEMS